MRKGDELETLILKDFRECSDFEYTQYEMEDTLLIRKECYSPRYFVRKGALLTKEKRRLRFNERMEDLLRKLFHEMNKPTRDRTTILSLIKEIEVNEKLYPDLYFDKDTFLKSLNRGGTTDGEDNSSTATNKEHCQEV